MYICQICKKKPATIHLTDIHNNVKKEVHICESCAAEKGFNLQGAANLPQLLGLASKKPGAPSGPKKILPAGDTDTICPECGMTWAQFGERGRLGCPHDYVTLDGRLRLLIANQIAPNANLGDTLHIGKSPQPRSEVDTRSIHMRGLEKRLRRAVAEEDYEQAALLKSELDELRSVPASSESE